MAERPRSKEEKVWYYLKYIPVVNTVYGVVRGTVKFIKADKAEGTKCFAHAVGGVATLAAGFGGALITTAAAPILLPAICATVLGGLAGQVVGGGGEVIVDAVVNPELRHGTGHPDAIEANVSNHIAKDVPVIGVIYSVLSSLVYFGKGNNQEGKQRLKNAAIGSVTSAIAIGAAYSIGKLLSKAARATSKTSAIVANNSAEVIDDVASRAVQGSIHAVDEAVTSSTNAIVRASGSSTAKTGSKVVSSLKKVSETVTTTLGVAKALSGSSERPNENSHGNTKNSENFEHRHENSYSVNWSPLSYQRIPNNASVDSEDEDEGARVSEYGNSSVETTVISDESEVQDELDSDVSNVLQFLGNVGVNVQESPCPGASQSGPAVDEPNADTGPTMMDTFGGIALYCAQQVSEALHEVSAEDVREGIRTLIENRNQLKQLLANFQLDEDNEERVVQVLCSFAEDEGRAGDLLGSIVGVADAVTQTFTENETEVEVETEIVAYEPRPVQQNGCSSSGSGKIATTTGKAVAAPAGLSMLSQLFQNTCSTTLEKVAQEAITTSLEEKVFPYVRTSVQGFRACFEDFQELISNGDSRTTRKLIRYVTECLCSDEISFSNEDRRRCIVAAFQTKCISLIQSLMAFWPIVSTFSIDAEIDAEFLLGKYIWKLGKLELPLLKRIPPELRLTPEEIPIGRFDSPSNPAGPRLLSLDGGGTKGLITLQILRHLERLESDGTIKSSFDWIAGTSTGGLIVLYLALGNKTVADCRKLYFRLKNEVFQGIKPYSTVKYEKLLQEYFPPHLLMEDIKDVKVVITAVTGPKTNLELKLFTNYNEETKKIPIWQIARMTSAAPGFFDYYQSETGQLFYDGGLCANNPTLAAFYEAQKVEATMENSTIVSIGTGKPPTGPQVELKVNESPFGLVKMGKSGLKDLIEIFVNQSCKTDGEIVNYMIGTARSSKSFYVRLTPSLPHAVDLDETDDSKLLNSIWHAEAYASANRTVIQETVERLKH